MRSRAMRPVRAVVAVLILGAPFLTGGSAASAQATAPISGGGASFPQLEIDQWRADTARPPYNLKVDFQSAGSTFGRQKYLAGQFDFGQSDITFQPEEAADVAKSPRKNFVYVPISAGGIGFMYNLTGTDGRRITNLRLSQTNVCRVFTEEEIYWDDPAIVAENPGVPIPHNRVRPVVRSDGAGTSYNLSAFCIATAPDVWGRFVGLITTKYPDGASDAFAHGLPASQWPPQYGAVGTAYASDGVANTVANDVAGKDTVTYNEAGFALARGFPNAAVRNAAGNYLLPNAPNVSAALAYATGRPDGTFTLQYLAPDPNAYFPSAYSYAIAQTTGFDPAKGLTLATFLNYAVTAGQKRAEPLGYARLSNVLVNLALDKISQIPGAPPRPTDLAGAPPPPAVVNAPAGSAGATGGAGQKPVVAGNNASKGPAAAGAGKATAGATGGPAAGAPAAAAPGTPEAAAADAAAAAAGSGTNSEGVPQIDVSRLPALNVDSASASDSAGGGSTPVAESGFSGGAALGAFALGFALVGVGAFSGSSLSSQFKRKAVGS